jgi:hypothetical protein
MQVIFFIELSLAERKQPTAFGVDTHRTEAGPIISFSDRGAIHYALPSP